MTEGGSVVLSNTNRNAALRAAFFISRIEMLKIAVTGGVACGKTTVCNLLREPFPPGFVSYFSCDAAAADLLRKREVTEEILRFGMGFGLKEGSRGEIDRIVMRELLFENSEFRVKVEGVLHPLVLKRVNAHLKALPEDTRVSFIEVPLLYEVEFPVIRDLDLVVAASETTQTSRLCQERGLEPTLAKKIIRSQLPIQEKMQRADIVVWNDGDEGSLEAQTKHLVTRCEKLFY